MRNITAARHEVIVEAVPVGGDDPMADVIVRCACGQVLADPHSGAMMLKEITEAVSEHYLREMAN